MVCAGEKLTFRWVCFIDLSQIISIAAFPSVRGNAPGLAQTIFNLVSAGCVLYCFGVQAASSFSINPRGGNI